MQTISTGYQPEFGLGALYAGQNAANAQAINDEELAKLFLANQQAQQSYNQAERINPLDIIKRSQENQVGAYDAALANAKRTSPSYIPHVLSGYEGQMKSQGVSGKIAEALMPKKLETEQITQDVEQQKQNALWTLQDIDKKILSGGGEDDQGNVVPFTPGQIDFMRNKRQEIANQLATTPEFVGKQTLQGQGEDAAMARAQLAADIAAAKAASRAAGTGVKAPKTAEEALIRRIAEQEVAGDITPEEAQQQRAQIEAAKRTAQRAPAVGLVPDGKGGWKLGEQEKVQPYTPPVSKEETKEINGVTYVKVPGGWKKK